MARKKQENPFEEMDPVLDAVEVVNQPDPEGEVIKEDPMYDNSPKYVSDYPGGAPDRSELPPPWDTKRTEFLMSKLVDGEHINGRPKHNGLRRLVLAYLGKIITTKIKYLESFSGDKRAACTARVIVQEYETGEILDFSGSADCNAYNTGEKYQPYCVASVETISRGRAFKEMLAMNVYTAEEISVGEDLDDYYKDLAPPDQMAIIDNLCKKLNIDGKKLLSANRDLGYSRISEITKGQARALIGRINLFQRGSEGGGEDLPKNLEGYKTNWLNKENNS
jgi:hypothetical protein